MGSIFALQVANSGYSINGGEFQDWRQISQAVPPIVPLLDSWMTSYLIITNYFRFDVIYHRTNRRKGGKK